MTPPEPTVALASSVEPLAPIDLLERLRRGQVTASELALRARELPPTLSVDESLPIIGLSRAAAFRSVHAGELPAARLGHRIRILTVPLLRMVGIDVEPLVSGTTSQAQVQALSEARSRADHERGAS